MFVRRERGEFQVEEDVLVPDFGVVSGAHAAARRQPGKPGSCAGRRAGATDKYEAYVGVAYTRLRQVPVSYSGLIGGKASLARDWGKYFQLIGSVDYYTVGTGHAGLPSPGNPSVYTFLVGPGLHANLYGNLSGQVFAEAGRRTYRRREHDAQYLLCRRLWRRLGL